LSSGNELKNPENDAIDFSSVLKRLGFFVKSLVNADLQKMDTEIASFGKDLDHYDIGLFYFAGHGMQINGENFITAVNTDFDSEISAKYSSVTINKVLAYMERARNQTNILILDACRNNPYERSWNRSASLQGLAPMYAPKGTLIAYATSPGEKASDGLGRNGLYTSALLKHIEDDKISIEEFFKRVRNSVYAFSNGKQTSWEHTSLTGSFKFNSGQLVHSTNTPYSTDAIVDKNFNINGNDDVSQIIKGLKTYDWYKQSPAVSKIDKINPSTTDKNKLFVLGRNILQTADGGEFVAIGFMKDLENRLQKFTINSENHFLNGILFEMYFDSNGKFRNEKIKNSFLKEINALEGNPDFKKSFDFINQQLAPFEKDVFYIPGTSKVSISFDVVLEKKQTEKGNVIYNVKEIKYEGKNVLINDKRNPFFGSEDEIYYESLYFERLKSKISELTSIPVESLTVSTNFDLQDDSKIGFPFGYVLSKATN
ncbi:MAG: caspase family protein, partial [Bacteroidetes bacterium]|nr:caspase family protein [Bacteroidota bacterium]